jgi:hypothetical protein
VDGEFLVKGGIWRLSGAGYEHAKAVWGMQGDSDFSIVDRYLDVSSVCFDPNVGLALLGHMHRGPEVILHLATRARTQQLWSGTGHTSRKLACRGGLLYFGFGNSITTVSPQGRARAYPIAAPEDVLDFAFVSETQLVVLTCVELFLLDLRSGSCHLFRSLVDSWDTEFLSLTGHRRVSFCSVAARAETSTDPVEVLVLRSDSKIEVWQ